MENLPLAVLRFAAGFFFDPFGLPLFLTWLLVLGSVPEDEFEEEFVDAWIVSDLRTIAPSMLVSSLDFSEITT